jgi:hypothetical protein
MTQPPPLRIVKGDPSPEEVAALVAVIGASAAQDRQQPPAPRSEWAAPHRRVRGAHRHGPGRWRLSGR